MYINFRKQREETKEAEVMNIYYKSILSSI